MKRLINLPRLTHLYWNVHFHGSTHSCIPNFASASLQYLTILNSYWYSYQFNTLLERTPRLRKLCLSLNSYEEDDRPLSRIIVPSTRNLSIEKLTLSKIDSQCLMVNLLQLVLHVRHLKVQTLGVNLDGHQWEEMIANYISQLKFFQFNIAFSRPPVVDEQINEERVDQYLAIYRTRFWIEHKKWFFRCQ